MKQQTVTVVTISFGERWKFLSRVVDAVMRDPHVGTFVIVDNGSKNSAEIAEASRKYSGRIVVLKQEKNIGSAGGFAVGIAYARTTEADFVFLLDDDSVPEEGAIGMFLDLYGLFPDRKVVLCANRNNLLDNKEVFYHPVIRNDISARTFFEVLSWRKFGHFFNILFSRNEHMKRGPFVPIVPNESFVYGGAFIPMEAVRAAPLPDASLFLYGDDIEYSWGIKKLGYRSYVCSRPGLVDVDSTFSGHTSYIVGQFDPKTAPFRVYYRMRNMVRLSRRHSTQSAPALFLNIAIWTIGMCIIGAYHYGINRAWLRRVKLVLEAVHAGYRPAWPKAKEIETSFFS